MPEVPSVLVTAIALVVHLRGIKQKRVWLILTGAALLGLGVNLRETVGLYSPWLVIAPFVAGFKVDRKTIAIVASSLVIFLIVAVGPFAIWFALWPVFRLIWITWCTSCESESERHPISI